MSAHAHDTWWLALTRRAKLLSWLTLALAVLVGLLANTLLGVWWLDSIVALIIAVVAVQEGREAWEGEKEEDNEG